MTAVATDLYDQSEDDVFAIAAYVMSLKGLAKTPEEQEKIVAAEYAKAARLEWGHAQQPAVPSDPLLQKGAKVFESQCVTCHKADGKSAPLALTSVMNAPDAYALIDVTYNGIKPPRGSLDRSMPARASQISDEDMVALAAFARARFTSRPAWTGVDALAKSIRSGAH
jgi:mono/diheme cytochrome c family protein